MNILQIVPNKGWGGGEKYVWELSRSLSEAGHSVSVVVPPCEILAEKFVGLNTHTLRFRGPYDLRAIRRLTGWVREQHIEVIHTHLFKHAMAALLARKLYGLNVKVVMTRHLCRPAKGGLHYPWLYSHVDRLIFVSEQAKETFLSTHPKIDPGKICVIHNSVKTNDLVIPIPFAENGPDSILSVGFAGTLSHAKGVDFLLDVARVAKREGIPVQLQIAGRGSDDFTTKINASIKSEGLGENIRLIGFTDQVIVFFGSVDAVIIPSVEPEAFPLASLEAMAAGRAVLFSEYLSPEIIVEGHNGILIDVKDPQKTARLLYELHYDRSRLKRLGCNGYRRFETHFAYSRFMKNISDLYANL